MSVDLNKNPDYEQLVKALLEKTTEGKLSWHETASEKLFMAAVKGQKSFLIQEITIDGSYDVTVIDADGSTLLKIRTFSPTAGTLYDLARRLAMKIDENLESAVDLLRNL